MASINDRKNDDGTRSFVAQVRIKPFRPASKTFHQADYRTWREARDAAKSWAEQLEKTLRQQRGSGAVHQDVASLKVRDLIEKYLADPATKALGTYSERERQMGWWIEQCGSRRALEFPSPLVIREARDALLAKHEAGTVNRYLAAARACINFARAAGLLPTSSVWPPRLMLPEPKGRDKFLTDDELARVLEAAKAEGAVMYAAVMFAVGVGCRQGEMLRLRWGDIDETGHTVSIRVTKTTTSRRAHLPPAVVKALKALHPGNVVPLPTAFVFADEHGALPNHWIVNRWEKIRVIARVPAVRWHDLRHASASFLIQGGATLAEVAHQLGHLSHATTKRYAHLVPGAKPTGADKLNEKLSSRNKP
jgi:integrase